MGRHRHPTPTKFCQHCGAKLERKMYGSTLEDMAVFKRRKYCDLVCFGLRKNLPPTTKTRIYRQAERIIPLGKTCRRCGSTEWLGRHHVDQNPLNNDPSNVVTLCASCHAKEHWENGKTSSKRRASCDVCGAPSSRRGLCQKHWQRFAKYGDPLLTKRNTSSGWKLVRVSKDD